jgi:hypothetical protein
MRSVKSLENLKKSGIYQNIMKAKEGVAQAKQQDSKVDEESEEESEEDEPEYEIEHIPERKDIDAKVDAKVAEVEEKLSSKLKFVDDRNEIEERTKKWLAEHQELTKKEKEEIKRQAQEELNALKEENKKLKSLGAYNDHLSRISHLARNVSIKF